MKNKSIRDFHEEMSLEEVRCERLRNLIGPMWNLPDMLKLFMNGEDLNQRKDVLESMINRIETSKPFLLKAMDPTATKEELSKLYPDQNE
jgi:hypothetical protein